MRWDWCRAARSGNPFTMRFGDAVWSRPGRPPKGGGPAGWPRHPHQSIPLLPSGPGGVFNLASRGADRATIGLMRVAPHLGTGGERGIRTPEARFRRLHTFQACSFNRSDTSPGPEGAKAAFRGANSSWRGALMRVLSASSAVREWRFRWPFIIRPVATGRKILSLDRSTRRGTMSIQMKTAA